MTSAHPRSTRRRSNSSRFYFFVEAISLAHCQNFSAVGSSRLFATATIDQAFLIRRAAWQM
jgi:hypothetical protein